jgi:hypothetical protein
MVQFEYLEDREFFCRHLAGGDPIRFEREFAHCFDFRPAAVKRREFNKMRKRILQQLIEKYGENCQLRLHSDCSKQRIWEPDHIVPVSTNELNKRLRKLPRIGKAKVIAQSFGSNHPDNLTLACRRCNSFKKNRLIAR